MRKQILTGVEFFEEVIEGDYFYIDKTLFIKELLENRGKVTLITRPRRFGKTMNMSMLRAFFSIGTPNQIPSPRECSKSLFDRLKIMEHEDIVEKHMNKYPVVFLTLKNVEFSAYKGAIEMISGLVASVYQQNLYICDGESLNEFKKKEFYRYCAKEATESELQYALSFLTECLQAYHGKRAIVLLDEYDAPITYALGKGYYSEMISFMRSFLGSAFKTNDSLEFGVLTGVQRISRESLFSSFNNPLVCGIMDTPFSTSFGFTEGEVKEACEEYGFSGTYDEVKSWYDGYRFGGRDMYNPWSITGYLKSGVFENYWVSTGGVDVLRDIFYKGDDRLRDDMASLLTGAPITMSLEDGITYPVNFVKSDTFWTMFLNAGYVKPCNGAKADKFEAELVNREVRNIFSRYAENWLSTQRESISQAIAGFAKSLLSGDAEAVREILNEELLNNPS